MTKAEELRQRIIEIFLKPLQLPYQQDATEMMVQGEINKAEQILKLLADMGCGVWTERGVPIIPYDSSEFKLSVKSDRYQKHQNICYAACKRYQQDMLKYIDECFEPIRMKDDYK